MRAKAPQLFLRLILGAVFIYAAYTKLRQSWLLFALSIDSYQLLPEWAVLALARTLPWFELALGVLLIAGVALRALSVAATAILGLFFSVMLMSYFRGASIDCGCFGVGEALSVKTLAARRRAAYGGAHACGARMAPAGPGFGANPESLRISHTGSLHPRVAVCFKNSVSSSGRETDVRISAYLMPSSTTASA